MKLLLSLLAALLLVGAIIYSLSNWTTPFTKLRVREEAAAGAPIAATGSPSGPTAAVPQQSPSGTAIVSAIHGAASKVTSWFAQLATPPKPAPATAIPPAQPKVAAVSPPTAASASPPPRDANTVTIIRDVSVQIKYGIVGLRRGTKVVLVSRDGAKVHIRDSTGEVLVVPASATDLH